MDCGKEQFVFHEQEEYPEELRQRYEIIECFKSGSGCETFLAVNKENTQKVVIKRYDKSNQLFGMAEPESVRKLHHPNIPAFVEEWQGDDYRFVVREYIEGQTLAEYGAAHTFTERETIEIGIRLCDILCYLHSLKLPVVHRDIKPQNIILQEDGAVFLIDFGISRIYSEEKSADTVWCGTRDYAAPEQYGYMQTGVYSDIYSFGMTLTWMLTKDTIPIRAPKSALEKILAKCTAFDPQSRFQSIMEVRQRLNEFFGQAGSSKNISKKLTAVAVVIGLAIMALTGIWSKVWYPDRVRFEEPLVEEAVRLMLDRPNGKLTAGDLEQITKIYIIKDKAFISEEHLREGEEAWEEDDYTRGEMTSLQDLRMMPNLTTIMIWGEHISDISPLSDLSALEKVDFSSNDIADLSPLRGKEKLYYIGFCDNPLQDISVLDTCKSIELMDLRNTGGAYSGEVLKRMGNFDFMDIGNESDSYLYLDGKTIDEIKQDSPGLTDLECIKNAHIRRLFIYWSEISDISALTDRKDIAYFNMAGCDIKDAAPLLTMPNLQTVVASESQREMMEELEATSGKAFSFTLEYID